VSLLVKIGQYSRQCTLSSRGPPGLPFVSSTSQDYTLAINDLKAMWHRTLFQVTGAEVCFSFGLIDG
jgi:hypothetical protein